ncbi:MAG: hypothetical protein ACRCTQ_03265 [Brevinemataceae bacterium]
MKKLMIILLLISVDIWSNENIEFFPLDQLKPGMKGYALTVFQGVEPEKMDVEVVAYMPKNVSTKGLVLVRLSGKNVERTRVAAGMSGSPVYINGKLLGALAYTWSFTLELLAGVVPIEAMLEDKVHSSVVSFGSEQGMAPISAAWSLTGIKDDGLLQKIQTLSTQRTSFGGVETFKTVPSSRVKDKAPLKPGDSVAIKLVEGDITLSSIGTVTYVNGEDVYIYGHPMDGEGPISLPLSRSVVYDIIPTSRLSFKMGDALPETIGSTMFDGQASVYGRFDRKADMMPLSINIKGKDYQKTYNMNLARSRKYLPVLIQSVIESILNTELGSNIEKQINMSWCLALTNNQIVSNSASWVKETGLEPGLIKEFWSQYISMLWNNSLTHIVPEEINLFFDITDKKYDYFTINNAKSERDSYLPGEKVKINMLLGTYLDQPVYTNFSLTLPKTLKEGTYSIMLGSALAIETELMNLFSESYTIRSEKQLIAELRKPIATHQLQIVFVDQNPSGVAGKTFLNNIPVVRQSFFENTIDQKPIVGPRLTKSEFELSHPVLGGKIITINVVVPKPRTISSNTAKVPNQF